MKRYTKNSIKRALLYFKNCSVDLFRNREGPDNVYHACIQKTGSQWIKSVFNDPYIRKKSGLRIHPQFRYEVNQFKSGFPRHTFVPGLYIPYILFTEICKPKSYKTIYVLRDPRDVVVSWYYSMKYTHGLMGTVPYHRKKLKDVDEEKGIEYCIRHLQWKFSFVRSWWQNRDNKTLYMCKFEDLINNQVKEWKKVFSHCEIEISTNKVGSVLKKYTKEKMRKRDKKRKNTDKLSHYREDPKGWKEIFTKRHIDIFKSINGNLVRDIGYEW